MNYQVLINRENEYEKQDFQNAKYATYTNSLGEDIILEKRTLQAFFNLQSEFMADIKLDINSGYRTIEEQEKIYNEDKTYAAEPGFSEHHSGLCFDLFLIDNGVVVDDNETLKSDKYQEFFKKVEKKASKYGLILRYPLGREVITTYPYEPWHYRYVTISTAKIIYDKKITLEEYHRLFRRSGILLLNKKKGMTSRDVVNIVSKRFDTKKVGHNGTLDPLATGLLVVTINNATKINEFLTAYEKEYEAKVLIGTRTDTGDVTGKVLAKGEVTLSKEQIVKMINEFPKEYLQEVPIYSAVKINGKKLYQYARNGEAVELPKRQVEIKSLELLATTPTTFSFRTTVSKGCYIRSMIEDMGKILGVPLTMSALKRTKQGDFSLKDAYNLAEVNENVKLISITDALQVKTEELDKSLAKKIKSGNKIKIDENMVLFLEDGKELALYLKMGEYAKPLKMFSTK